MTTLVSYAQNFEDVMLWRALKHVDKGRYIDIGAQGPVIDSVSKFFHEQGWHGIHVEPTASYATQLREARPRDIVLQVAAGTKAGTVKFYEFPDTGLSTDDRAIAKKHINNGFPGSEIVVPCITLDDVLSHYSGKEIHWLKIDVEGGEQRVLKGWLRSKARPWIVLIESTLPLTQLDSHQKWESMILGKGYKFAYFDGLNRFYVADGHRELSKAFSAGPNLFDGFLLSRNSWPWCTNLSAQIQAAEDTLDAERKASASLLQQREAELQAQLSAINAEAAQRAVASTAAQEELLAHLVASQSAAFDTARSLAATEQLFGEKLAASQEVALEAAQHIAFRERELNAKLAASLEESTRLAHGFADREREFAAQLANKEDAQHSELMSARGLAENIQRALATKEKELSELLQATNRQLLDSANEHALQERQSAERQKKWELELRTDISQLQDKLAENAQSLALQKKVFEEQVQAAGRQTLDAAANYAAREREFSEQLSAREQLSRSEISGLNVEIANLRVVLAEREGDVAELYRVAESEAAMAAQTIARKELDFFEILAMREKELRSEASAIELELSRIRGQFDVLEKGAGSLRQELAQSQNEVLVLAVRLAERERLVGERALTAQSELHQLELSSAHREQESQHEARRLMADVTQLREAKERVEREIAERILSISEALHQRDAELARLQNQIFAMTRSASWRLTLPIRAIRLFFGGRNVGHMAGTSTADNNHDRAQTLASNNATNSTIDAAQLSVPSTAMNRSNQGSIVSESNSMKSDKSMQVPTTNPEIATSLAYRDMTTCNGAEFIENCYRQLLHREADASGKASYVSALNSGTSKAEIIRSILTSEEGKKVGEKVAGLWLAGLPDKLERMWLIGVVVAPIMLLIKSRPALRSFRVVESHAAILDGSSARLLSESEKIKSQDKFEQLTPAFLHTISSVNTFMHECQQRLNEIEGLVSGAPVSPDAMANGSINDRLLTLERLSASQAALLEQVQHLIEPIQNLVDSVPLASRSNARALTELRMKIHAAQVQLRTFSSVREVESTGQTLELERGVSRNQGVFKPDHNHGGGRHGKRGR